MKSCKKPQSRTPFQKKLRLESLETRQLLSASQTGDLTESTEEIPALISPSETDCPPVECELECEFEASIPFCALEEKENASLISPEISYSTKQNGVFYSIEFQISGSGTQWAYITGLSEEDALRIAEQFTGENRQYFVCSSVLDAEKETSNPDDDEMCWAASSADVLWYTGWANDWLEWNEDGAPLFTNEDEVMDYFCDCFTDDGGHIYYASDWWLTGNYSKIGEESFAQIEEGKEEEGAFYAGDYTWKEATYYSSSISAASLGTMAGKLRDGWGVGLGLYWTSGGGHGLSCWGYVYDTMYESTSKDYYVGLFITDSDDSQGPVAENCENRLYYNQIEWDESSKCYLTDYHSGTGRVSNYLAVQPYVSKVDLATVDGGLYSSETVEWGDCFSLTNISVSAGNREQTHAYTISVYASVDETIDPETDVLLCTEYHESVGKGKTELITIHEISTEVLEENQSYTIGWFISSGLDTDLTNNTGLCSTRLTVAPLQGLRTWNEAIFSTCEIDPGEIFSVSGIQVRNCSAEPSGSFTFELYASANSELVPATDVLLKSFVCDSLPGNSETEISAEMLDSSLLEAYENYVIYWRILGTENEELCRGQASQPLVVRSSQLTPDEYLRLKNRYEHLNFPELTEDGTIPDSLNVILLDGNYSLEKLKKAVEEVQTSQENDLIVLSNESVQELMFLSSSDELNIHLDSSVNGFLNIVVLDETTGTDSGTITINANHSGRILTISEKGTIGLGGLEFKNAQCSTSGGAIRNEKGVLTLEECTLIGNSVQTDEAAMGGAICNYYILEIYDSVASGNFVKSTTVSKGSYGGTVMNRGSISAFQFTIADSSAETSGGAIYTTKTLKLDSCSISGSSATYGAGIFSENSTLEVWNTRFLSNTASGPGGGIYAMGSQMTFRNSLFQLNSGTEGGAIYSKNEGEDSAQSDSSLMVNCLFAQNSASQSGGGIYAFSAKLLNCTITRNEAGQSGGGVTVVGGKVEFCNSIVVQNSILDSLGTDVNLNADIYPEDSQAVVSGTRNLTSFTAWNDCQADSNLIYDSSIRLFVNEEQGDFHLADSPQSQAFNLGANDLYLETLELEDFTTATDLDGLPRLVNDSIDLGAYENQSAGELSGLSFESAIFCYDGQEHTLTVQGLKSGDLVLYSRNGVDYSGEPISCTDAGEYTIYVKVSRQNFNDWTQNAQLTIQKVDVSVEWQNTELTYSGVVQQFTACFTDLAGKKHFLAILYNVQGTGLEGGQETGVQNVGTYSATASFSNEEEVCIVQNYTLRNAKQDVTILPVLLTIQVPSMILAYGNEFADPMPESFQTTGLVNDETLSEVLQGTPVWVTDYTRKSPAGTYVITVDGVTAQNYELLILPGTITVFASITAQITLSPQSYELGMKIEEEEIPTSGQTLTEWSTFSMNLWGKDLQETNYFSISCKSTLFEPEWTQSSVVEGGELVLISSELDVENGMMNYEFALIRNVESAALPDTNSSQSQKSGETEENTEIVENADCTLLAQLDFRPVSVGGVTSACTEENWLNVNHSPVSSKIVSVPFDLNDDGLVNIIDLELFARVYGAGASESDWAFKSDFDGNQVVGLVDLVLFAKNYSRQSPGLPQALQFATSTEPLLTDSEPLLTDCAFADESFTQETPAVSIPVQAQNRLLDFPLRNVSKKWDFWRNID